MAQQILCEIEVEIPWLGSHVATQRAIQKMSQMKYFTLY
jgi:hypothetical protein